MKIKHYLDGAWHKKIKSAFKEYHASKPEKNMYYQSELPIVLHVLKNTSFEIKTPAADDTQLVLKTVNLDDIESIKNLGKYSAFRKSMVAHHINEYLSREAFDTFTDKYNPNAKIEGKFIEYFRYELLKTLRCGKTESIRRLDANETTAFVEDTVNIFQTTDKIEISPKEKKEKEHGN